MKLGTAGINKAIKVIAVSVLMVVFYSCYKTQVLENKKARTVTYQNLPYLIQRAFLDSTEVFNRNGVETVLNFDSYSVQLNSYWGNYIKDVFMESNLILDNRIKLIIENYNGGPYMFKDSIMYNYNTLNLITDTNELKSGEYEVLNLREYLR